MVPRLALVLLLVVLAGCAAVDGGASGQPAETRSVVPTASSAPVPDAPTDATAANTVEYAELSAAEKRAFDAAVEGEARFFHESPYVEGEYFDPAVAEPFERHEYVRKDGAYYALSVRAGEAFASYRIRTALSRPGEDATVVALEELAPESRDAVRRAIENGSYAVPFGKWGSLPDDLSGVESVRYADEHYRIRVVVADARVQAWRAERVG